MNKKEFDELVEQTYIETGRLLVVKGKEYSSDDDRLANFKRTAELAGITPLQSAMNFTAKHFDAIASYVRADAVGSLQILSEPIEGRLHDLINYCYLMKALIAEQPLNKVAPVPHVIDSPIPEKTYWIPKDRGARRMAMDGSGWSYPDDIGAV